MSNTSSIISLRDGHTWIREDCPDFNRPASGEEFSATLQRIRCLCLVVLAINISRVSVCLLQVLELQHFGHLLPDGTAMATQQSMELFLNVLEFFLV